MSPLTAWANFYVITGSSSGALIGLTFVVITLVSGPREHAATQGVNVYTSPTVVHFCAVLFVAAVLSAPWSAFTQVAAALGIVGLAGVAYAFIVVRRFVRNGRLEGEDYTPGWDDWLWFAILPCVAYVALFVMALLLLGSPVLALFGIGAVILLLLGIGIRNAWDLVTYLGIFRYEDQASARKDE